MSDEITITISDREYKFSPPFTNRELHTIKKVAGVRAGEMQAAMEAGDNDLTIAMALIAVQRTGAARPTLDELWDLPVDAISVDAGEEDPTPAGEPGTPQTANGNPETTPSPDGVSSTASSST